MYVSLTHVGTILGWIFYRYCTPMEGLVSNVGFNAGTQFDW